MWVAPAKSSGTPPLPTSAAVTATVQEYFSDLRMSDADPAYVSECDSEDVDELVSGWYRDSNRRQLKRPRTEDEKARGKGQANKNVRTLSTPQLGQIFGAGSAIVYSGTKVSNPARKVSSL